jgi:hypothetical protein
MSPLGETTSYDPGLFAVGLQFDAGGHGLPSIYGNARRWQAWRVSNASGNTAENT